MTVMDSIGGGTEIIVIGGEAAKGKAAHLGRKRNVRLLSDDTDIVRSSANEPFEATLAEFAAGDLKPFADRAEAAVVATEHDRVALRITQLLNTVSEVERVLVRVDDPDNRLAFEDVDCEILEVGKLLGEEVERKLGEPAEQPG